MREAQIHFEVEVLHGTLYQPLCENNAGRDALKGGSVEMTCEDRLVTCSKCRELLGFEEKVDD
jgi:hypothetical protein